MTSSPSRHWFYYVATVCLVAGFLSGCGDGRPKRVHVSGRVLIDGQPVTSGTICIMPENARPASGDIGPDGQFTMSCFETNDGVVPGTHRVTITSFERIDSDTRKWFVPKKYSEPETSGLNVTIEDSTDSLTINLTWDGGKPFVERLVGGQWQ